VTYIVYRIIRSERALNRSQTWLVNSILFRVFDLEVIASKTRRSPEPRFEKASDEDRRFRLSLERYNPSNPRPTRRDNSLITIIIPRGQLHTKPTRTLRRMPYKWGRYPHVVRSSGEAPWIEDLEFSRFVHFRLAFGISHRDLL